VSRADPLETAALAVAAGHLTLADAYRAVSLDARAVLGLPAPSLQPGSPAELLAVRGTSLPEVIGGASEDRRVFHRGRLVADTRVTTRFG
jgi:cytosine deaminase